MDIPKYLELMQRVRRGTAIIERMLAPGGEAFYSNMGEYHKAMALYARDVSEAARELNYMANSMATDDVENY